MSCCSGAGIHRSGAQAAALTLPVVMARKVEKELVVKTPGHLSSLAPYLALRKLQGVWFLVFSVGSRKLATGSCLRTEPNEVTSNEHA